MYLRVAAPVHEHATRVQRLRNRRAYVLTLLCRTDQLPEEARPGCELQEHLLEAPIGLMPLFIRAMHIARLQANVPTYAFSKDVT